MRFILIFCLLFFLIGCSEKRNNNDEKVELTSLPKDSSEHIKQPEPIEKNIRKSGSSNYFDSLAKVQVNQLDSIYSSTPFYSIYDNHLYYIVSNGEWNHDKERFGGELKYGVVDEKFRAISKPVYDKIYNPGLTLQNCMEIKSEGKVGLLNFVDGKILEPQFDYIIPGSENRPSSAYGIENGKWFEINSNDISIVSEIAFEPTKLLQDLSFDIQDVGESMMYDSYNKYHEDDANVGRGVVIVPSYMEYLHLLSNEYFVDIILDDDQHSDFGTLAARMKIEEEKTVFEEVKAFFVSAYEEGVDARGYALDSKDLVVYNPQNNQMQSVKLGAIYGNEYFCRDAEYHFLNDSIIEVRTTERSEKYSFETTYSYYKITPEGDIQNLSSDRHYDYTKFVIIDKRYFEGCYAYFLDEPVDGYNLCHLAHLTIEDLDIMRNEIFAEYGYIFKTEKWQNFFSNKPWYKPQFENVNDQLTDIDKVNIQTILKVKESMIGNEESFVQKKLTGYAAPG